nr:site-specific integrase [Haloferax sp. CBA1149]
MTNYQWSRKSLDELREFHWETINPQMMRGGLDFQTIRSFYEYLVDFRREVNNPVENAGKQFRWEQGTPNNRTMTADQIREMYDAATSLEDELPVLGLASWGLRPGELASMHVSQLALDVEEETEPYLAFDERKNGPGTVALLYDVKELYDRIEVLDERPSWNGYIFPSSQSSSGHLTTDTINNRFKRLARACNVCVDGSVPTEVEPALLVHYVSRGCW